MRPAHLAMLSRTLPFHSIGGMQAVAWDLARQFAADGVRVSLLTTRIPGRPAQFEEDGVEVVAFAEAAPERYSAAWWRHSRGYFEERLMGSVTGVLSVSAAAYGVLPLKPRLPRVPFVFQAHGTALGEFLSKWRTRRLKALLTSLRNLLWVFKDLYAYPRFDTVVAVGSAVETELRRPPIRWALPADRIRLIRNGIDASAFARDPAVRERMRRNLGLGEGERLVVSASRLHRQKGVDLGLRAFARLAGEDPAVRYLIVGDGPERGELEALSRALGVMDRVIFAGAIAREQLPEWLQAGDAFLFTTTCTEGLPLNILEALAVGLPAVVSDSLQSVIEISPAVQGVNPSDTVAVAEALRRALAIGPQPGGLLPEPYTLDHCARQYRRVLAAGDHV